jgi:hypothetical protein
MTMVATPPNWYNTLNNIMDLTIGIVQSGCATLSSYNYNVMLQEYFGVFSHSDTTPINPEVLRKVFVPRTDRSLEEQEGGRAISDLASLQEGSSQPANREQSPPPPGAISFAPRDSAPASDILTPDRSQITSTLTHDNAEAVVDNNLLAETFALLRIGLNNQAPRNEESQQHSIISRQSAQLS